MITLDYVFYSLIALVALNIVLIGLLFKLRNRFKLFLSGSKGKNWEEVLNSQVAEIKRLGFRTEDLEKRQKTLAAIAEKSSQKIGLVRYNPFREIGGNQSFSLAVLDNSDNGFVLSALFATERSRVYIKPVKSGKSPSTLTEEERQAIAEAQKTKVPRL